MAVYVLLFNARTDNEGIHTLRMQGIDVVLMFENEDDATRYGLMLEAQDFPEATVEAIDQEDVEDFCESAGYEYRLVPDGHLRLPPEVRVEEMTWNPNQPPERLAAGSAAGNESKGSLSQTELDRLRQQFEKLL
jgi:hypothetical protein